VTLERAFTASYDSTTKAVSAVVCLSLLVVAWLVHVVFIAPLFFLLILLAYAYSPRGYLLTKDEIVVRRPIGNIRVPLAAVREIRSGTPADFTGCVRLWGSGGLFGYYGTFRTARLGKCYWYMTSRSRSVIIATPNKTLVLSPDDVPGFIAACGAPSPASALRDTPQIEMRGNPAGVVVGIAAAVVGMAAAALALVYSPGPPTYTLTADRLTIHDRFYPVTLSAATVDADGIRIVDLTRDTEWRPTLRTNGFANRNYQSGWFRVAGGRTVRLYRAGGNRLVLIPPKGGGAFVVYQAIDPDRFVQELRRQWTSGF
jgi:hypothetical protein